MRGGPLGGCRAHSQAHGFLDPLAFGALLEPSGVWPCGLWRERHTLVAPWHSAAEKGTCFTLLVFIVEFFYVFGIFIQHFKRAIM